jgi:hypothetical protein
VHIVVSSDNPGDGEEQRTAQLLTLYLELLHARMSPDDYRALTRSLIKVGAVLAARPEGSTVDVHLDAGITDAVADELMTLIAIMESGRLDHAVVEVPGPQGSRGRAVLTADADLDPQTMRELPSRAITWTRCEHADPVLGEVEAATDELDQP